MRGYYFLKLNILSGIMNSVMFIYVCMEGFFHPWTPLLKYDDHSMGKSTLVLDQMFQSQIRGMFQSVQRH